MANPLNVAIKVTGLDQAKADLASFATIGKRSFNEIANEAKNFAQTAATTDPALRGVANRVRQLAAATDDAFASNLKLRQSISDVERALRAEMISAEFATRMTAALRAEHEKLATSTKAVIGEIRQLETIGKISYGGITAMAQRAAVAIKPTAQSTHDLAVAMKELSLAADPAAAAQVRLLSGLTQVKAALDQKIISTQQAIRLEQYLREQSQELARAEAELANKIRDAAIAKAQASIQAANAQKAASQIAVAAIAMEIKEMDLLRNSRDVAARAALSGASTVRGGPAPGTQGQVDLANQMKGLAVKANPIGAANKEYLDTIRAVDIAVKQTIIDDKQSAEIKAYLKVQNDNLIASLNKSTTAHNNYSNSAKGAQQSASKLTSGLTQLSFQVNDIATSLASGASPFMVIAQQGGQIFQVFQMFPGLLARVAVLLTNPFVLAAIAVTAVATSFAFLINRAGEAEARLRTYDVVLKAIGGSSQATAQDLEDVAKGLQHTGTSAEDAQKAVLAFSRTPLINKSAAEEVTNLARDIAAATGKDFVQVTADIAKAIATDTEAVIKLVQSLSGPNGLSAATVAAMKELARIGDPSGAAKLGLKSLQDQFGGSFNNTLSDGQKSINNIAGAWDNMLTKLQNTNTVKAARDAVIDMLNGIANAVSATAVDPATTRTAEERRADIATANQARTNLGNPYAKPLTAEQVANIRSGLTSVGGALSTNTMTPQDLNILVGVDPRAIGIFNEAKIITGELGAQVTTHGGTQTGHVKGSQHYPWNTTSGLGEAIDYAFTESPTSGKRLPYNYAPPGTDLADRYARFNATAAQIARERYGITAAQGNTFTPYDPGHIGFPGMPPLTAGTGGTPLAVGGALTPKLPPPAAAAIVPPGLTQEQLAILKEDIRLKGLDLAVTKAFGDSTREGQIYQEAYRAAVGNAADTEMTRTTGMIAGNAALEKHRIELQQTADTQRLTNSLALDTAQAFGVDEVEGYKKAAEAQAILAGRQGQLADAGLILQTQANEAILTGAKAIPGLKQQADATTRLAEAAKGGAGAEHEAAVQNQVVAATHDALTKAKATGNAKLIQEAELLTKVTAAQIKKNDAAQQDLQIRQRMNQRTDQVELVRQQTTMVGQLPETIEAANARLTEQQRLLASNKTSSDEIWKASMANVEQLNRANIAHAEAMRQQERINNMYQQIGSTIESAIGNVIDGIFDKKKAMDWGKAVKDMAKQMFTGIATNFFTKPLIGEVLGILGAAPTVTSQFGSFGGSTSGGGGTTTLGAQSGGTSLMGSLGQLGSLGSFAKDILGLDLKGMFSPVTDFFKDIGSGGGLFGTTPAEFIGPMQPGMSAVPGSVFGNTTMGGAFTGIAGGFAAGTMLNSLLGRKGTQQTTGMIGSGVGAIAGTLIGGPIGGIIGGLAGGGLGGLFGNPKGSNQSAGANIDLSQFKITKGFAGGNSEIDQQVAQMGQSLQGFLDLLKTTGGALSGNVLLQSGVNTGITVDSSLEGYSGRFNLGKDTEAATKVIEQALVKSITGVSDTMKTVLSQVGTDEDIARAIQFAKTYEDIAKAAEDAFSSIEDATKRMGPFEATMGDIKVIFEDLTTQATRFGLALEPINKALAEATKRLQDDFLDAIELASNVANKKTYRNTIQETIDAYLASTKEASGINLGADVSVGNDLGQLFTDQMKDLLSGLDESALKDVIAQSFEGLDSLNPLIDSLAQAAINSLALADATNAAADAAARGSAAYAAIADLLNSLQVNTSFAQSPEDAIKAANAQFFELFNAASKGSLEAMEGLAGASQDYINAIEQYYGSSEQGQTEVSMIEKGLQDLLDMNPALKPDETTLGGVATAVEGTTTAVTAVGTAITGTSQDIIDKNNANAEALIAQNNLSTEALLADSTARLEADTALHTANTDNLIAVQDANTLAQLAYDAESAATLIGSNAEQNDLLIAQSEAAAQALVDQGNDATDLLTAAYTDSTDALIADSAAVTEKLLADAADHSEAVLSGAKDQTDALLSQAGLDQEAAKAESQAATTALLAQAALDQEAAKAESQAATKALLDQATLDKEALLDKTQKTTDTLLEGASADTVALGKVIETVGEAIIDNATDTNAANIITAIEIMRDAITDNATDINTANIIAAIEIMRDAITDNATDINAANIIKAIEIWCTTIYDQIKTWVGDNTLSTADWLNTVSVAVEDGFVYVGNLIAEWSGKIITEMGGPNGVTKTIVAGASQNAATIVQSQANIHNSWGIIYDGWMKLQVKADSDNAIFIANHNNDDMKTTVEKLNADTNAMTKLHTDLTNSLINVEDKWGKNNDGWLLSINNWTSGTYENSKTMVTRLTEIRDAIRLQNA